jgi:hypothetical protein
LLRYRDTSLLERAFRLAAATTHADPHALREQMIARVQHLANQFVNNPAAAHDAKAIVAFLQDPHSLAIELSPAKPLDLATVRSAEDMDPSDVASLLGLRVTANQ